MHAAVMHEWFVAFIPLSNWLAGFDRYRMEYSKTRLAKSTYPDAFYMLKEGEALAPGLAKARALVAKLKRPGDVVVALRARLPVGASAMRPNDVTGTGIGWRWPAPTIPLDGVAWVDEQGMLKASRHEEVTARAFGLETTELPRWSDCRPRSFSVLPVAKACQARCSFCFSKASVSDLTRQPSLELEHVSSWALQAARAGAERAVITGGGEPTLMAPERLEALVSRLAQHYAKVVLITNSARLDGERLMGLAHSGLRTLAISRHGLDAEHDARIMGIAVNSAQVVASAARHGLTTRAVCVLQREGVATMGDVRAYVTRCAREGFAEVCFKELYVSSVLENAWASGSVNTYAAEHQVPLRVVLEAMTTDFGFSPIAALPWGSPVFEGRVDGRRIRVAAYTEPSVGWERAHRLARSWNLLADGTCVASLEDAHSVVKSP